MNNITSIILLPNKEESIKRFHPWIFSGAIAHIEGEANEGDIVKVFNHKRAPLAIGHYAGGSIAVRILTFDTGEEIDSIFWQKRLSKAWELRKSCKLMRYSENNGKEDYISTAHMPSTPNNVFRLVHGEGDRLPGLIIDVYGDTAVMQAHSAGMHHVRMDIAEALMKVSQGSLKAVYYKSEGTLPFKANLDVHDGFLIGHTEAVPVEENGIKFYPDWIKGQKTGFFIDQRDNRSLLEFYASGRKVLNMFCYTGGFSLYALRGGAIQVDSVDSSAKAMHLTKENVSLNFAQDDERHRAITADAFEFLEQMEQNSYDLIVLDPPAFAKHRKVLRNALIGYRKINTIAFKKIAPGGILFTFSCSQAVSKEEFRLAVFSAAAASGRHVRILHQLIQPADHPINIYHPEGEYLKGLVLQVE